MKSKVFLSIIAVLFSFSYAIAAPAAGPATNTPAHTTTTADRAAHEKDADKHKQVVEEYKKFLNAVPPATRDEVREYRKSILKINKEKTALYKKLSQEAQDFLASERKFKSQLPLKDRRMNLSDVM